MTGYLLKQEGILPTSACIAFGSAFVAILSFAIYSWPSAADLAKEAKGAADIDAKRLRPLVLVTFGWFALYYCFLQGQAAAAFWIHQVLREAGNDASPKVQRQLKPLEFADVKYGPTRSKNLILTMDRAVGNLLEHRGPRGLAHAVQPQHLGAVCAERNGDPKV